MGKVGPRWGNARHGTVLSAQGVQYDLLIIEALLLLGCHTSGDRETCRTVLGFPDFQCAACCLPRCESSVAMAGMCYTKTPKLWVPSRFGWTVWTGWTLWAGENLLPRFQTKIFLQPSKLDHKTQTKQIRRHSEYGTPCRPCRPCILMRIVWIGYAPWSYMHGPAHICLKMETACVPEFTMRWHQPGSELIPACVFSS